MNILRHMEMLRAKCFAALEKLAIPSRLKSIKSRASFLPTAREGNVFTPVCLFTEWRGRQIETPYKKTLTETPQEGTWDQRGSDIIHPRY